MESATKESPAKLGHPIQYTIFKPNNLINADRTELRGMEIAVYNEILNHNHKDTPEVFIYKIPYSVISYDPSKNGARDRKRIGQALQSRSIYLSEETVRELFGEGNARSIAPFPEVVYNKDDFEVHISPKLKEILSRIDLGFTKGDIDTLRGFRHDISHSFYWVARQKQSFHQVWKISVEDFRKLLFIRTHKDWRNFRRNVIDNIQEDMQGTWVEFDIEFIRKGKGGAVKEMIFKFKKGPKDEKDSPVGQEFKWEKVLQKMGVNDAMIKQIRRLVKAESESESPNGNILWDSYYIDLSIEAAREQYRVQNRGKKKIENLPAWFYSGLVEGRWLDYVNTEKEKIKKASQIDLF